MSNFDLGSLLSTVKGLRTKIVNDRERYRKLVREIYEKNPPLYRGQKNDKKSFDREVSLIYDLVKHCLIIGDDRLLHEFVVDPIRKELTQGYLTVLSNPSRLDLYISRFSGCRKDSKLSTGKLYWELVINVFAEAKKLAKV